MGSTSWATYLWPGLPQMWRQGSWPALAMAVGFAALLNLALAASLLWTELFAVGVRNAVWVAVVTVWGGSAVLSYRWDRAPRAQPRSGPAEDPFHVALDHYLQGRWFESEHVLRGLLGKNPRDLDAGLMLATLLRRTGRPGEAEAEFNRLERFEGSQHWALEIARERELLRDADRERLVEALEEQQTDAETAEAA